MQSASPWVSPGVRRSGWWRTSWPIGRSWNSGTPTHPELATVDDVRPPVPHQIANALAAAAMARLFDVQPRHIGLGLRQFEPARHRIAEVGRVDDVLYIDDSKATNAHAADMSLRAYDPVV